MRRVSPVVLFFLLPPLFWGALSIVILILILFQVPTRAISSTRIADSPGLSPQHPDRTQEAHNNRAGPDDGDPFAMVGD